MSQICLRYLHVVSHVCTNIHVDLNADFCKYTQLGPNQRFNFILGGILCRSNTALGTKLKCKKITKSWDAVPP